MPSGHTTPRTDPPRASHRAGSPGTTRLGFGPAQWPLPTPATSRGRRPHRTRPTDPEVPARGRVDALGLGRYPAPVRPDLEAGCQLAFSNFPVRRVLSKEGCSGLCMAYLSTQPCWHRARGSASPVTRVINARLRERLAVRPGFRTQTVEGFLPHGGSARLPAPHATTSVQPALRMPRNRRSGQACATVGTALASPGDPARWRGRVTRRHNDARRPTPRG